MLTWEEIAMLNKKLSTFSFINLLADANMITSTKITIEMFEDYMSRILVINKILLDIYYFKL